MTILVCQEENLASDWLTQRCDGGPGHHRTGRYGGPGHNRAPRCQLILQHWLTENSIWPTFCLATLPTSSRRIVDHDHNSWVSSPAGWEKTRNRAGAWTDYLQNCPRDFENCPRALIRRPEGPVLLEARGKNFFDFWTSLDAFIDHFLMIFSFFSSSTQFSFLS